MAESGSLQSPTWHGKGWTNDIRKWGKGKMYMGQGINDFPFNVGGTEIPNTQLGDVNMHNRIQRLQKLKTCHLRTQTHINSKITYWINSFPHRAKWLCFHPPNLLMLDLKQILMFTTFTRTSYSQLSPWHLPQPNLPQRKFMLPPCKWDSLWWNLYSQGGLGSSHFTLFHTSLLCRQNAQKQTPAWTTTAVSKEYLWKNSMVYLVLKFWDSFPCLKSK